MNKTLSECLSLTIDRRGVTPKKLGSDWSDKGYRVLSANNVKTTGLQNINEIRFVDEETYKRWMKEEIEKGDIILTSEAPAGEVLFWDSDEKIVAGQRVYILRTRKDVDALFLKYYIQSEKGQAEIRNKCSGSTVFGISAKTFDSIEIVLPESIDEQKKISTLLYDIDKKIENNNKINAELESMAKTIYDYWFLQFEFPNEDGKPYKSSGGKMVWNEELKREIPEGWEVKELLDFCTWESASQPPKSTFLYKPTEGYIRFIQNRDYESDENITYVPFTNSTKTCDEYDILIDKYGDKTAGMVRYGIKGAYNVALGKITPKIADSQEYIRCYLASKQIFNYLHNACMASTRSSMNETVFKGMMVPIPNKRIMEMFSIFNREIINKCLKIKDENRELAALRDFLLPMLMNGQIGFKE